MQKKDHVHLSKFLSLILRHRPEEIDLTLDQGGWAEIDRLLSRANRHGVDLNRSKLEEIVHSGPKTRFEISPDGKQIRARYGHSIAVDLGYRPQQPPGTLYHGTARRFLDDIQRQGLQPQNRRYVHLSATQKEARSVGGRHGAPVILKINARRMYEDGWAFYPSTDQVWLVEEVPGKYLHIPD